MQTKSTTIIITLIISILLCTSCSDNEGFVINGKITEGTNSKIVLEKLSPIKVESIATTNSGTDGNFEISSNDSIRRLYRLRVGDRTPIHLCLANSDEVQLTINTDTYTISGSNDCMELKSLYDRMTESTKKVEDLRAKVSQQFNIDKASLEESNSIASELYQSDKQYISDFIRRNHTSPIIYLALHQYVSTTPVMQLPDDYDTYKYVLDEMKAHNPDLEETRYLESTVRQFELQQEQRTREYVNLSVGSQAPDFSMNDVEGNKHSLSDFGGKETSLCFWASWDKKSISAIQEYIAENSDRQIILISLDNNSEQWLQAISFNRLESSLNLCDFKSWESITAKLYGVKTIPTIIEISAEQKIQ